MKLVYDPKADAAAVLVRGELRPGERDSLVRLDEDRFIHYDANDAIVEYQFLNVRRFGVRLDDLENAQHREELGRIFHEAGVAERDWGHPIESRMIRRRRDIAAS